MKFYSVHEFCKCLLEKKIMGFSRKPPILHSSFIIYHFLYLHFSYNSFVLLLSNR